MWSVRENLFPSGVQIRPSQDDKPLSFRELFSLLGSNVEFAHWYSELLAKSNFEGFFLEFPPLTISAFEDSAEFVIIESTAVANLRANPTPFAAQFSRQESSDVITFPNLGGDALLIVPARRGAVEVYPHLATFLRKASEEQIRLLWQVVADAVRNNLSETPRWLSTSGLGVSWLHLRLDSWPKYYNYAPYKVVAPA